MAQWANFQYTGYPPQGQQQQQQLPQQFQQQPPPFQQIPPQPTGFPGPRPPQFQLLQSQPTGFPGPALQPLQPPQPPQFLQRTQTHSFLNAPPPLSGLAPQPTGFPAAAPLVAQPTGFIDPRLRMMTSTFMPVNTSAPYAPSGAPQLAPQQGSNLQQSIIQHNQNRQGTPTQNLSWAITKAEKKQYNAIFRVWDSSSSGFLTGTTALEVFGTSGLPKDELARIWYAISRSAALLPY
jgi:hypothetical protein